MFHYVKHLHTGGVFFCIFKRKMITTGKAVCNFLLHATTYHDHVNTFILNSFFLQLYICPWHKHALIIKTVLPDGHLTWFPVLA